MLILKIIVIIGGFCICAFGGYRYSQKYTERERYFSELLQFCDSIIPDISFAHLSLYGILEKNRGRYKSLINDQLSGIEKLLDDNRSIDDGALKEYIAAGLLTADEYESVIRFFNVLGKSDADNQTVTVQSFKAAFTNYHNDSMEKKKKYSSLYWKLGLLAGAAIAVFII